MEILANELIANFIRFALPATINSNILRRFIVESYNAFWAFLQSANLSVREIYIALTVLKDVTKRHWGEGKGSLKTIADNVLIVARSTLLFFVNNVLVFFLFFFNF